MVLTIPMRPYHRFTTFQKRIQRISKETKISRKKVCILNTVFMATLGYILSLQRQKQILSFTYGLEEEPLVTVILTSYNVETYIQTSLMSIVAQSYKNLEIIVIDDASTDFSVGAAKLVAEGDKRVTLLSLPVRTIGGVGIPVNVALRYARGDYIAFVDGDDVLSEQAIARMIDVSRRKSLDFLIYRFRTFDNAKFTTRQEYDLGFWPKSDLIAKSQSSAIHPLDVPEIFRISPEPWRKLYKKGFLEDQKIEFPEGDFYFEDNAFHWLVLTSATKIAFIEDEIYLHRENRKGQTTENISEEVIESRAQMNTVSRYNSIFHERRIENFYREKTNMLRRAGHFMNINYVGSMLRNCKQTSKRCSHFKYDFLLWTFRHKWLLPLAHSHGGLKLWKKFSSLYLRILTYWKNEFRHESDEIPRRKLKVPREVSTFGIRQISLTVILYYSEEVHHKSRLFPTIKTLGDSVEFFLIGDGLEISSISDLAKLESDSDNVFFLNFKKQGFGRSVNSALPLCEGEYITIFKNDDILTLANLDKYSKAIFTIRADILIWLPNTDQSSEENHSNWKSFKYTPSSEKTEYLDVEGTGRNIKFTKGYANQSRSEIDNSTPMLFRRKLMTENFIFYGGSGFMDELQFNWILFLKAKSVYYIRDMRQERNPENAITQLRKQIHHNSFLNTVLSTNRALLRGGIKQDFIYHQRWIAFCSEYVTILLENSNLDKSELNLEAYAKEILNRVQSGNTDLIVRRVHEGKA